MARLTMEFVSDIMRWSRTTKSARLRLDCARYLVNGWPLIWKSHTGIMSPSGACGKH